MLVISLVGFAIQDNLGDPLRELVGQSVSEEVRQQLRDELGLDCTIPWGADPAKFIRGSYGSVNLSDYIDPPEAS